MEIINIFLAGSIKLEAERNLVRTYANKIQADQCAKDRDIAINITTFENFSSAITETKAQELYDAYIHTEADYAMFIFDNEVGGISKHEFEIAFDSFKNNNKPRLYVYFKKSNNYCSEYEEIRQLLMDSNNYFLEYDNLNHLTMMINNHLIEIVDLILEEIIRNSYRKKGMLKLVTNHNCSVYEKNNKLTSVKSGVPCMFELAEGVHCLCFKDTKSSKIIDRKVRVIGNSTNVVEIKFPREIEANKQEDTEINRKLWYYMFAAAIIISIAIFMTHNDKFGNILTDFYKTEEPAVPGGQTYQDALEEIEKGNLMLAADKLQTVINNEPEFASPYIHLANIYIQQGYHEDAKMLLETALELDPDNSWAISLKKSISF